jgi:hypothetical protein
MNAIKTIRIISRGRQPYSPWEEVYINGNGNAKYTYIQYQAEGTKKVEKFKLSDEEMEKIDHAVEKHKFFTLSSFKLPYLDGDEVQMIVSKNGKTHKVVLTNFRLPAFNKIVLKINQVLPKKYRVCFNALNAKLFQ